MKITFFGAAGEVTGSQRRNDRRIIRPADVDDLRRWIGEMAKNGGVGRCFLVHGGPEVAARFSATIRAEFGLEVDVPRLGDPFTI